MSDVELFVSPFLPVFDLYLPVFYLYFTCVYRNPLIERPMWTMCMKTWKSCRTLNFTNCVSNTRSVPHRDYKFLLQGTIIVNE